MKNKNILRQGGIAVLCLASSLTVRAQSAAMETESVELGMGIRQKRHISTASVQTVSGEELRKTSAITLKDALYGRILGLTAIKSGGFAGDENYGGNFNIRGIQTTSDNNILILVDGIERSIDYLTVDEVESVSVFKDAAAVALYGYEGVNGIIYVKTKRGSADKKSISVSYDHKFTFNPSTADFVDAYTYAKAMNMGRENDGLSRMYNDYELNSFSAGLDPYYYPDVNWKDELFKNKGSEDRINVSLSGGNEKLQYFAMLDYTDCRGLLNNAEVNDYSSQLKMSKANVRLNLDAELTSSTFMQVNAFGSFIETNRPAGASSSDLTWMLYQTPASAFPVRNNPEGQLGDIWGGSTVYGMNNIAAKIQSSGHQKSHSRMFQGDITLRQSLESLIDGLSVSARLGYNNFSEIYEQNLTGYMYGYEKYLFDSNGVQTALTSYSAGDKTDNIAYNHWLNRHSRSSFLSVSADYTTSFTDKDNFGLSLIWFQKSNSTQGQYMTFNRMSYMANLHYDIDERYIADVVLSYNGSNRSYPQKWAFSPVVSLGYVFAKPNEDKGFNYGKLRASAGMLHTDYVPVNGIWLENYNSGGDYYFGSGTGSQYWGSFIGYQPTSDFKLETAYKFNIGADMRLAKCVDITAEVFYNLRDNILLSGDGLNSLVMGIPSAYVNRGRVAAYGAELGINYVKNVNKDLSFNIGAGVTWGRNEILRTIENVAYDHLSSVGGRVNQAWGLISNGFFTDENDITNSFKQEFDICRPGDVKYKDQTGDGVINENDVVKMGYDTSFPELNFSLNLGFRFRNFGFSALLQGAGMYTQYLGTTGVWTPLVDGANLSKEYYDNCWGVSPDPKYPRLTSVSNNNNYRQNDIWYQNINFLKLRNCEVYYLIPQSIASKLKMSQCKLYVNGENLFTLSNLKTMDPENIGTLYPTLMGVNVGVSLKF